MKQSQWILKLIVVLTAALAPWHGIYVCTAQSVTYKLYTTGDGLPSATIYHILQDREGFMWYATDAGVSRFDGKHFTNYTLKDGLGENEILVMGQDHLNRIWFLGFSGSLSYFHNGKIYNNRNDSIIVKVGNHGTLLHYYEDKKNRIWLSSVYGYTVIDGTDVQYIAAVEKNIPAPGLVYTDSSNKISYINSMFRTYTYLDDGSLLYPTHDSIMQINEKGSQLIFRLDKTVYEATVEGIAETNDKRLWLSTATDGVYCYDLRELQRPPEHYLPGVIMTTIRCDKEDNVWAGTRNKGIYMIQPWHGLAITYNSSNSVLPDNSYSVTRAEDGTYIVGSDASQLYEVSAKGITQLPTSTLRLPHNRVVCTECIGPYLFAATDKGLLQYDRNLKKSRYISLRYRTEKNGGDARAIKAVCKWKNGLAVAEGYNIYVDSTSGCIENGEPLVSIDANTSRKYTVFADRDNMLWYSATSGLYSYDGHKTMWHPSVNEHIHEKISDIAQLKDGTLVLATHGNGLIFMRNDSVLKTLGQAEGLAHDICRRLFIHDNTVYVATAGGITVFNWLDGVIGNVHIYTTSNGLATDNVNDIWANDAVICASTSGGLTFLNARTVARHRPPPMLYITAVHNMQHLLQEDTVYHFDYKQNSLQFDFIGISFRSAAAVHYRYRLSATEPWMYTDNNSVIYSSLLPSNYRFEVSARIHNEPWSAARIITFYIATPFWRTWWFVSLLSIISATGIFFLFRYRVRANARKQTEGLRFKRQITELEQQALQAMMNPHFIFNVMNTIQQAINESDTHRANIYLSDFARLIRMNLEISAKRYITLEEEIAWLELYLSLEQIRFGQRLRYTIVVDPTIDQYETLVPVMLLQPYIENAIWHGILPGEMNGYVQVDIMKHNEDSLCVTITDNGVGRPHEPTITPGRKTHVSRGMQLTRQRLELLSKLTGKEVSINIEDAFPDSKNRGTRVIIIFPSDLE